MHLTLQADYALRSLLYLATFRDRLASTQEMSEAYGISRHHLVRVLQRLERGGFVRLFPGRHGGVALAREPSEVRLGDVVRCAEPNMDLVECFSPGRNTCRITPVCALKAVLHEATDAFLAALDGRTLADVAGGARGRALAAYLPAPAVRGSRNPGGGRQVP